MAKVQSKKKTINIYRKAPAKGAVKATPQKMVAQTVQLSLFGPAF